MPWCCGFAATAPKNPSRKPVRSSFHPTEVNGPLQQCNEDAHRLLAKIQEIEASMRKLTEELEEKARDYDTLQDEHQSMFHGSIKFTSVMCNCFPTND